MSCEGWKTWRLGDFLFFNPKESISKGVIAKKIAMEKVQPFTRMISGYEDSPFSGGSKFRNGDTLLARITPCLENGKTAQVTVLNENEVGFGSTEFIVLRESRGISDNNFVYYFTNTPWFRDTAIHSMVGSSGRQRVQQDVLENLEVGLPELNEQKRIAKILSSLDDKIELNNQINANLEQQAQALFKSWFIDFEPFKDGEFVESELGLIPKGWKIISLQKCVELSNKAFNPIKNTGVLIEHYSIPAYDINKFPVFEISDKIKSNKYILNNNNFVISKLNPATKRIWRPYCLSERAVCSTEFLVFSCKESKHKAFFYSLIDSQGYFDFLNSYVTGSTGSRQRVIPSNALLFTFALPPKTLMIEFCAIVDKMYNLIDKNAIANHQLQSLRDTLLPKLMSGEIEV